MRRRAMIFISLHVGDFFMTPKDGVKNVYMVVSSHTWKAVDLTTGFIADFEWGSDVYWLPDYSCPTNQEAASPKAIARKLRSIPDEANDSDESTDAEPIPPTGGTKRAAAT